MVLHTDAVSDCRVLLSSSIGIGNTSINSHYIALRKQFFFFNKKNILTKKSQISAKLKRMKENKRNKTIQRR